jgi:hypothetical protein
MLLSLRSKTNNIEYKIMAITGAIISLALTEGSNAIHSLTFTEPDVNISSIGSFMISFVFGLI